MTNTDGVYVQGRQIDSGDCSGPRSARNVLVHPDVDAAVFETARGGILREGLGFDRCAVAVVTNIGERRPPRPELHHHRRGPGGAQARDRAERGAERLRGAQCRRPDRRGDGRRPARARSCFFAADRQHPVMATHRAQGRRVVYVEGDAIVAAQGSWRERLPLAEIPLTRGGTHRLPGGERDGGRRPRPGAWAWTGTRCAAAWPASSTTRPPRRAAST